MLKELASLDEVHDEVDAIRSLNNKINAYNEWVIDLELY